MPTNPSLSSFTNSSQYQTETRGTPLLAGFIAGSTFVNPNFNGQNNATSVDPGGLFGWLVYSRAFKYSPALGSTGTQYIVYTNPNDLVSNLNQLGGVTYCLVSTTTQGGTYGFFKNNGNQTLSGLTAGYDFLNAISYLAYGGTLVIAGSTTGLAKYETDNNKSLDVLMGTTTNTALCTWLTTKPYLTGIFPTPADSTGQVGASVSMAGYTAFVPAGTDVSAGSDFGSRVFNISGYKTVTSLQTDSVVQSTTITYSLPAVSDVAGAFARAKDNNELYLTVAGINRSTILNGLISNAVKWEDTSSKNTLRTNRVNFYVSNTPQFLGQDIVGATGGTSTTIAITERIGPSRLQIAINNDVTNIALKYLYLVNNATTRSSLNSEISTYLEKYAAYLDTTKTQIICDGTNNTDNSTTLNVTVIVRPILSTESLTITLNLTQ